MDETYTTLSEVLELLDSVDGDTTFLDERVPDAHGSDDSSTFSSDDSVEGSALSASAPSVQPTQQLQLRTKQDRPTKTSRKERNVPYSTVLQRRKKEELRVLRKEAVKLEEQLELLKTSRLGSPSSTTAIVRYPQHQSAMSDWRHTATVEHEKRQRSERTNRELRAIMENQLKVHRSIRKILGKKATMEGWDFVFHPHPRTDRSLSQMDASDVVLADLSLAVEQLRLQTDSVFTPPDGLSTVSCSLENKHQTGLGDYVEVSSVTTVACPFEKVAKMLWHHNITKSVTDPDKSYRFKRMRSQDTLERNCLAALRDGIHGVLQLDGLNMVRRFENSDRTIMVGSTTWFLPTDGLRFENNLWTLVSRSPLDPEHACVVQSCYQLRALVIQETTARPEDLAHARKLVMSSMGKKLRDVTQMQQNVLLEKVAALNLTMPPVTV